MTFDDLKEIDKFGAFNEYVSVPDAKLEGVIPKEYHAFIPDKCVCGSENIITRSLTQPMCCNPRCRVKLALTLTEIVKSSNVQGVGEATCKTLVDNKYDDLRFKSVVELVAMPFSSYPYTLKQSVLGNTLHRACVGLFNNKYTLPELVALLKIPGIDSVSTTIFKGSNSLADFCTSVKNSGKFVDFCNSRGVYDTKKIFYLYTFMRDIHLAETVFRKCIRKQGNRMMNVCITGSLKVDGVSVTRSSFIKMCNEIGCVDNMQLFEIKNTSAVESVPYVIADYRSGSSKYLAGERRGVLITAQCFIDKLRGVVAKWK